VFGFSSGDLFVVDNFAKRSMVVSSVAAYLGAHVPKFQPLALDFYGSFLFFALSSRLPLVAPFVAVLVFVAFLGAIAWAAWPELPSSRASLLAPSSSASRRTWAASGSARYTFAPHVRVVWM
jgi:hypothetical protein